MPLRKTPSSLKAEKASVENYDIELNDFETLNKSLLEVLELVDRLSPKNTFKKTIKNVLGMLGKHIQILANNCNEMSNSVDNVEVDLAKTDQYSLQVKPPLVTKMLKNIVKTRVSRRRCKRFGYT